MRYYILLLCLIWSVSALSAQGVVEADPNADLMQSRAQMQQAYQALNAMNPLSGEYGKNGASGGVPGLPGVDATGPNAEMLERIASLQKILSNPAVHTYLKLFNNPAFSRGMSDIVQHPNRMTLLYVEIGLLIFMLIFRAWRYSKVTHWFRRLIIKFYTFIMYVGLASFVAPWVVLGQGYYDTVTGLVQLVINAK
jgi:hypothetical protein